MEAKTPTQSPAIMTHVILSNGHDEKHIRFPTETEFTDHLKRIRELVPDRRWEISESWED